jgi:hypothetical protein
MMGKNILFLSQKGRLFCMWIKKQFHLKNSQDLATQMIGAHKCQPFDLILFNFSVIFLFRGVLKSGSGVGGYPLLIDWTDREWVVDKVRLAHSSFWRKLKFDESSKRRYT